MKKRDLFDVLNTVLTVLAIAGIIIDLCLYVSVFGWVSPFSIF